MKVWAFARLLLADLWGWSTADQGASRAQITAAGLDPDDRRLALCAELSQKIMGYPRHLSQHVGGFIVTKSRLDEIVPIENAAMDFSHFKIRVNFFFDTN